MKIIYLIGNLVDRPQGDWTKDGTRVAEFRLAVDGHEYVNGERVPTTDYYDVKVYDEHAENALRYLDKGDQAAVVGNQVWGEYELTIEDEIVCYESGNSVKMRPHHVDALYVRYL